MKRRIGALLILGTGFMLALNLPGQMSPDSVSQLLEGRTGHYESWHPPVMAWLLGLFDALWPGPALFVVLDAGLLLGAWLLLLRLAKAPGWGALAVALILLLAPQFLLHQGTVWKDMLFADSAIAAFACLAAAGSWRQTRAVWLALSLPLFVLAALTRQNGLVLLPVAALAVGWLTFAQGGWRTAILYGTGGLLLAALLFVGGTLALSGRSDGGEGLRAEIVRAQAYDLIGALKLSPEMNLPLLDHADPRLSQLMRHDGVTLYSPVLNDTLEQSPDLMEAVSDAPAGLLFAQWKALVLDHPGLYLRARWPVFRWTIAAPDVAQCHPAFVGIEGDAAQLNALGMAPRIRPTDRVLARYTRAWMGTPVLSHLTFAILAALLMVPLLLRRHDADIAIAGMLAGALLFTLSFFVVSIACDYRYLDFLDLAALTAAFYWAASRQDDGSAQARYKN
jgi:hypothetical protein